MNGVNHYLACLVLLSAASLMGCSAGSKAAGTGRSPAPAAVSSPPLRAPIAVEVFEVKAQARGEQFIPAILSTEATATLLAQRDGTVIELRGREGEEVTKGEELARLSDDDLRAQFEQAQLEITRSSVEERQFEALVKVNQTELEQEAMLLKEGLISKRQLDRAQYKLEGSIQELEKARLATQTARARLEAVKIDIEKCVIRAPMTGIVTHRYAKLGTSIMRGEKLFEVAQLSPLTVKFQLPADYPRFAPGHLLNLSLAGSDRTVAQARIRQLDPVAEAASNTRGYLADVIGGAGLIPGLAVTVRLRREGSAATFSVPRAAFPIAAEPRPGAPTVLFILDGNRARSRAVWVSVVDGDRAEIFSGLAAGERVILLPPADLKASDLVQVTLRSD